MVSLEMDTRMGQPGRLRPSGVNEPDPLVSESLQSAVSVVVGQFATCRCQLNNPFTGSRQTL